MKGCAYGACLKRIGEDVSEKLDYVPAVMQVERNIRPKYACPACDGEDGMPVVRIAPMPPQIIPKGIATPSLLTQVITAKFVDSIWTKPPCKSSTNRDYPIPPHRICGSSAVATQINRPWSIASRPDQVGLRPQ